jgi:hypothetical protein
MQITEEEFQKAIEKLVNNEELARLAELYQAAQDQRTKQVIEEKLIKGVEVCAERKGVPGIICNIVRVLKMDGLPDAVLIKGVEVCSRVGRACDVSDILKKENLSDAVTIKVIEVCGESGWIGDVAGLLKREGLSEDVKKAVETGLIKGVEVCREKNWVGTITGLLKTEGLPKTVISKAINVCSTEGWATPVVDLLEKKGLPDDVMIEAIWVCVGETRTDSVVKLLEKENLSDAVIIEAIKACAAEGEVNAIAKLLGRKLSDDTKKAIEEGLINGIEICAKNKGVYDVVNLLKMDCLPDAVLIKGIEICLKEERVDVVTDLLERGCLSDGVKKVVEKGLVKWIKGCAKKEGSVFNALSGLLEKRNLPKSAEKAAKDVLSKDPYHIAAEYIKQTLSQCAKGNTPLGSGTMQSHGSAFKGKSGKQPTSVKNKLARKV